MHTNTPFFSFIIPVYNRPEEVAELLASLKRQTYAQKYEIVIVEDGSQDTAEAVIKDFKNLPITYLKKENTGPGPSRNYGMRHAQGDYFIILDSDCVLPPGYLEIVAKRLEASPVDCFGGPDAAHPEFNSRQKAISFSMTSVLTTGGLRGKGAAPKNFQPRSFNMGLSRKAFEASGGFGDIHPGEDPDLVFRLWAQGFETTLIEEAFVYHKRRITWEGFYTQVNKFGKVRPILTKWHPHTARLTYWFPSLFFIFLGFTFIVAIFDVLWPFLLLVAYLAVAFIFAAAKNKSFYVGLLAVVAVLVQFTGYGLGFLESTFKIHLLRKNERAEFPKLFFD